MPSLRLESSNDFFDLDHVLKNGRGVQSLSGATGLGLPPVAGQWLEGAGDGAVYRGRRVLPREIDLPLLIAGSDRKDMKGLTSRLSKMLAAECTIRLVEDDGTDWSTKVVRVGGGSYTYGEDTTGNKDLLLVVTVRAGDPYWTSSVTYRKTISNQAAPAGLLSGGSLSGMSVASSQAMGDIELENVGDADAYPVWGVYGPGDNFKARSPSGQLIHWTGTLAIGDVLTVDTKAGTVVDQTGANRYAELSEAPRFWSIPPGTSTARVELLNVDVDNSRIDCTWRPRNWMVI